MPRTHDIRMTHCSETQSANSLFDTRLVVSENGGEHYYAFIHVNDVKNIPRVMLWEYSLRFWCAQTITTLSVSPAIE